MSKFFFGAFVARIVAFTCQFVMKRLQLTLSLFPQSDVEYMDETDEDIVVSSISIACNSVLLKLQGARWPLPHGHTFGFWHELKAYRS
jgi:hypothetical protein